MFYKNILTVQKLFYNSGIRVCNIRWTDNLKKLSALVSIQLAEDQVSWRRLERICSPRYCYGAIYCLIILNHVYAMLMVSSEWSPIANATISNFTNMVYRQQYGIFMPDSELNKNKNTCTGKEYNPR